MTVARVPAAGLPPARALRMLYVEDNRINAILFEETMRMRGGIELQEFRMEHRRHVSRAQRHAGVAGIGSRHGIHRERADCIGEGARRTCHKIIARICGPGTAARAKTHYNGGLSPFCGILNGKLVFVHLRAGF